MSHKYQKDEAMAKGFLKKTLTNWLVLTITIQTLFHVQELYSYGEGWIPQYKKTQNVHQVLLNGFVNFTVRNLIIFLLMQTFVF